MHLPSEAITASENELESASNLRNSLLAVRRELQEQKEQLAKHVESSKKSVAGLKKENQRLRSSIDAVYELVKLAGLIPSGEADAQSAQDELWQGEFGADYVERHFSEPWEKSRVPFWKDLLGRMPEITSVLELGCNIGANLKAIESISPKLEIHGVEINPFAVKSLRSQRPHFTISESSILSVQALSSFDLVFTRGVLIHIAPENLPSVYDSIYALAKRYILINENFSPYPRTITTYGKAYADSSKPDDFCFYRDFASELSERKPRLQLVATNYLPADWTEKSPLLRWTLFQKPS